MFLSNFNTEEIYKGLEDKIGSNTLLTDDDILRFIILPLTQSKKTFKQSLIDRTINLTKQVQDEHQQLFIVAGVLTATNKFIE